MAGVALNAMAMGFNAVVGSALFVGLSTLGLIQNGVQLHLVRTHRGAFCARAADRQRRAEEWREVRRSTR